MSGSASTSPRSLRLSGLEAANDALSLPEASARPYALLRIVPVDVGLETDEVFERDAAAFEAIPLDPTDPDPIMIGPWDRWLDEHPETPRRYAGLHVALHPTLGVYASAATFEELVERVQAARIPGVETGDLLLTSFGPGAVPSL